MGSHPQVKQRNSEEIDQEAQGSRALFDQAISGAAFFYQMAETHINRLWTVYCSNHVLWMAIRRSDF